MHGNIYLYIYFNYTIIPGYVKTVARTPNKNAIKSKIFIAKNLLNLSVYNIKLNIFCKNQNLRNVILCKKYIVENAKISRFVSKIMNEIILYK